MRPTMESIVPRWDAGQAPRACTAKYVLAAPGSERRWGWRALAESLQGRERLAPACPLETLLLGCVFVSETACGTSWALTGTCSMLGAV